jgi:hypothetical protein
VDIYFEPESHRPFSISGVGSVLLCYADIVSSGRLVFRGCMQGVEIEVTTILPLRLAQAALHGSAKHVLYWLHRYLLAKSNSKIV